MIIGPLLIMNFVHHLEFWKIRIEMFKSINKATLYVRQKMFTMAKKTKPSCVVFLIWEKMIATNMPTHQTFSIASALHSFMQLEKNLWRLASGLVSLALLCLPHFQVPSLHRVQNSGCQICDQCVLLKQFPFRPEITILPHGSEPAPPSLCDIQQHTVPTGFIPRFPGNCPEDHGMKIEELLISNVSEW